MSNAERKAATATGRKALDAAGLTDAPLCVGTGGGSAQITIELCREAAEAGASHALVICPGMSASSSIALFYPPKYVMWTFISWAMELMTPRLLCLRNGTEPTGYLGLLPHSLRQVAYPRDDLQLPVSDSWSR